MKPTVDIIKKCMLRALPGPREGTFTLEGGTLYLMGKVRVQDLRTTLYVSNEWFFLPLADDSVIRATGEHAGDIFSIEIIDVWVAMWVWENQCHPETVLEFIDFVKPYVVGMKFDMDDGVKETLKEVNDG